MKNKPQQRILYSSREVRLAIRDLFGDSDARRIAISAFVGVGSDAYLPFPKGIRLICSPTPGGTNPNALRELLKKKVQIEFVDRLHMKVYWAQGRGAIITSANLSTNALGMGGLKEAGILLGPHDVDIDRILNELDCRPAEPELDRLDRSHREYFRRNPWSNQRSRERTYAEWFDLLPRTKWKLFVYSKCDDPLSNSTTQQVELEFGKKPADWLWSQKRTAVRPDDCVLCAYAPDGRLHRCDWLFVDKVLAVPRSDPKYDSEFPFEVIQVHSRECYEVPPFAISPSFNRALGSTSLIDWRHESDWPFLPQRGLLDEIRSLIP